MPLLSKPGSGERAPIYHGQGVGVDDAKERLLEYFHRVDPSLHGVLRNEQAPLVLAGVEYLLPLFRNWVYKHRCSTSGQALHAAVLGSVAVWQGALSFV